MAKRSFVRFSHTKFKSASPLPCWVRDDNVAHVDIENNLKAEIKHKNIISCC